MADSLSSSKKKRPHDHIHPSPDAKRCKASADHHHHVRAPQTDRSRNPNSSAAASFRPIFPFAVSSQRLLDLYEIGRELGRGGSGVVRLCKCLSSGQNFACKSILKKALRSDADISDVRKEVDVMSRLSRTTVTTQSIHRNVVRLHQVLEDQDEVHLVMELCRGGDLFDRLEKKATFSETEAARILKNLMMAVQSCHASGIIHRDISLENILLVDETPDSCDIRLADFGMSEAFKAGDTFTRKVGTAYYVAPEVLLGPCYTEQVDVWSSGVVLYMLLCGEPPFWGPTDQSIWNSIIHGQLCFPQKSWNHISSSCKNLISEMMCRDPDMRMTPAEVLAHPWILHNHTAPSPAITELPAAAEYRQQQQPLMDMDTDMVEVDTHMEEVDELVIWSGLELFIAS